MYVHGYNEMFFWQHMINKIEMVYIMCTFYNCKFENDFYYYKSKVFDSRNSTRWKLFDLD